MKKKLLVVLLILGVISLTACQGGNVEELKKSEKALQVELDKVKKERDKYKADYISVQKQLDEITKQKKVEENDVTVVVVDKVNIAQNISKGIYSDRSEFHISITNNTDKDIKGIQGVIDIQDLFGVSIKKFNCDLVGKVIKPKETIINKNLGFDINEFMDDHVKVFTNKFDDLKFVYTVNKIVFTDGTIKE
ncbi:hypothetical protein PV797_01155 [Clostridiaceae bacterium M8S5]|nr:hypothetical protein PV797_01155 [Clostridiaceae bacterium M8S5]